jgi:RNA polymerase sigma-70 factor, ECF subfamily
MYSMDALTSVLDTRDMPARLQALGAPEWLQLLRPAAGITMRVPDEPSPDAEVCRLLAAGERDRAFERLLAAYRGRVYRLALGYVRSQADAEDLAQEAFVRLWRALPLYDGRASFSTWLYVIARNACLSELRRRGIRPTASLDEEPVDPAVPSAAGSPVDVRMDCETLVEMLDEPQRRIVRLFYLEERSYEQVAEMLDMPINTVRSHLHRARKRLAALTSAPAAVGGVR